MTRDRTKRQVWRPERLCPEWCAPTGRPDGRVVGCLGPTSTSAVDQPIGGERRRMGLEFGGCFQDVFSRVTTRRLEVRRHRMIVPRLGIAPQVGARAFDWL